MSPSSSLIVIFKHFIFIADAMSYRGSHDETLSLWNEQDGMYYDAIHWGPGHSQQLPIRSLVGLIPLYATLTSVHVSCIMGHDNSIKTIQARTVRDQPVPRLQEAHGVVHR